MTRPAKRQYGEGSINEYRTKRGARFRVQWYEPLTIGDLDGPKRRRNRAGFATRRDAAAYLRERILEAESGRSRPSKSPALASFIETWLAGHRAAESTISFYERLSRLHIIPHIGSLNLHQITPNHLARLYRLLERTPSARNGHHRRALGPNTIRKVHALLRQVLESAVHQNVLVTNPALSPLAQPPTQREVAMAKPPITVWTPSQLSRFYKWSRKHSGLYYLAWRIIGETGCRRGEALGLVWGDINLESGRVHFQRSRTAIKTKGRRVRVVTGPLKNLHTKIVSVPLELRDELAAEKDIRAESQEADIETAPVILSHSGKSPTPDYLYDKWVAELVEFRTSEPDVPRLTLHELRHTHATHLLAAGIPVKAVQMRLGHATASITLDTYGHVMPSDDYETLARLEQYRMGAEQGSIPTPVTRKESEHHREV